MKPDLPSAPVAIGSQGLSDAVAAERLRLEGPNELPTARPKSTLRIGAEVVREPMFLLLIATGAVYLVLGSVEEAVALAASIFVVIGITLYQETKTERTLQALRDVESPGPGHSGWSEEAYCRSRRSSRRHTRAFRRRSSAC